MGRRERERERERDVGEPLASLICERVVARVPSLSIQFSILQFFRLDEEAQMMPLLEELGGQREHRIQVSDTL